MAAEQKIPIVIAVDNKTIIPMFVTVGSVFENAKPDTECDVHILSSEEFSAEDKNLLEILKQKYKNQNITLHRSSDFPFTDIFDILSGAEKCIWLSPCTVIREDLTKLFHTELSDNCIAGARDAYCSWPENRAKEYITRLDIRSAENIIDSDVMLLNLKEMRSMNLPEKLKDIRHDDNDLSLQDLMNKSCYKKIRMLPLMYNLMLRLHPFAENVYEQDKALQYTYSLKEWNEACNTPIILNFDMALKPWEDFRAENARIWWQAASRLPYFGEIFNMCADDLFACINERDPLIEQWMQECEEYARNDEAQKIKETVTFKTGAAVVYIPRKIKGIFKK